MPSSSRRMRSFSASDERQPRQARDVLDVLHRDLRAHGHARAPRGARTGATGACGPTLAKCTVAMTSCPRARCRRGGPRPSARDAAWRRARNGKSSPARPARARPRRARRRRARLARAFSSVDLVLRDLQEKARGLADAVALDAAVERVGEHEALLGARDADVAEPALLLELLRVVHRARVRERRPPPCPVRKTAGNSSPLAEWSVIRVTRARLRSSSSMSATRAIESRKALEGHVRDADGLLAADELLGGRDQLFEVLEPRLGLGGALGLERVAIARRHDDLVDERGHRQRVAGARRAARSRRANSSSALARLGADVSRAASRTRPAATMPWPAPPRPADRAWPCRCRGRAPRPRGGRRRRRAG